MLSSGQKMTPMYQQQMMQQQQQRNRGPNVFQTLNQPGSKQGGQSIFDAGSKHMQTSIDVTTNHTGNSNYNRSPGIVQHSVGLPIDPNQDLATNIFNFAPQTQRMPINLEEQQDSLNQGIETRREGPSVNEFGEMTQSLQENTPQSKKRQEMKLVTQLQPKLINPPSKLTKTLENKDAKASYTKKKPSQNQSRELNNF